MTEARYRFETIPYKLLSVPQGVTFYQRWQFRFAATLLPFPFFSNDGLTPLWTGACMIRNSYSDVTPLLSLSTVNGGIVLDCNIVAGVMTSAYYSIYMTAVQTAALPAGKLLYDVEFSRISDGWVIRTQRGKMVVAPEITK